MTRLFLSLLLMILLPGLLLGTSSSYGHGPRLVTLEDRRPPSRSGYCPEQPHPVAPGSVIQEQTQHPIDKALEACIDRNGSTAGMVECTDEAYLAWDKELNKNYGELMRALKPAQKEALRLAQLEWIKYRDLDFKLIDSIYDTLQGTMYTPMRIDARMEVVKKRALELKDFLDLVKEGGE